MKDLALNPILWPIAFPLAAGVAVWLVAKAHARLGAWLGFLASAATVYTAVRLWGRDPVEFAVGPALSFKLDYLSRLVLLSITAFGCLISLYSVGFMKGKARSAEFFTGLLWTVGISAGAVLAADFILMLVFWGLLGIALYLMISLAGPPAAAAAKKSFIIVGGTDSLMVLGIVIIWHLTRTTSIGGQPLYFDGGLSYVAFFCILSAALAKAGAMPFHSWIPDCGEKALVPVTAFLPASLDKLLGIYLVARLVTSVYVLSAGISQVLMFIGAATIILAVMMALVQHDLKRLLSYHAVSQVGYMVMGIGTGIPIGIAGGIFHMLNHAMYKSTLFLGAGAVEEKTGTTDLDKLGGLAKAMPATFISMLLASLAISGVPPMNGFASKWMVYQGVIGTGENGGWLWVIWLVSAMLGSALTLASFAKILHAVFLRKASPAVAARRISEVGPTQWLPMTGLALACLVFGVAASALPIKYLILPAVPGAETTAGIWWSGPATVLLAIAFAVGGVIYWITTVKKARECPTYIGGETMNQANIPGLAKGETRDVEVTGVDFYETMRKARFLRSMYAWAERKYFDLYDVGATVSFYFVNLLRRAHTGLLPAYLTWVLVGVLGVMAILILNGIR